MTSPLRAPAVRDAGLAEASASSRDRLVRWLTRGGDERIEIDARSGCNKYGVPAVQSGEDVWLGSSTANPLSPRSLAAVEAALDALAGAAGEFDSAAVALSARVRTRIEATLGLRKCSTVLAASGTDAELLALAIAKSLRPGPLTNIVIAPEETGSAVPKAALGCHFGLRANSGAAVTTGRRLDGWEADDISVIAVPVRDAAGAALPQDVVDDIVLAHAEHALRSGRTILLHVLDRSKTGLQAPRRSLARHLMDRAQGRAFVLVDACQLRCDPSDLAADLAEGCMVVVTGSKFVGGFPFAGALLLPEALTASLSHTLTLPPGLAAYSTLADWPDELSHRAASVLSRRANAGLALRWISALAELAPLAAIAPDRQRAIAAAFARRVDATADAFGTFEPLDRARDARGPSCPSIRSLLVKRGDGGYLTFAETRSLHRALQTLAGERRIYLGQAVEIGDRGALRVCLAAPHVVDVSDRMTRGDSLDTACGRLDADIRAALDSCARLARLL